MAWTEERVERLQQLWEAGVGTAEIGERLGMTKNAIIGKAHRIGLKPRRASPKRSRAQLVRLNGMTCQWPFGEPGKPDFHFCGKQIINGKSYCAEHYARAYIRVNVPDHDKADAA
ncbi:MAG: GcrA family cell cycle regulator [Alphaproteobacteria bacterium]|nr:GcrA family cell cycle regulator [Alphaproteobacteria bacterium]